MAEIDPGLQSLTHEPGYVPAADEAMTGNATGPAPYDAAELLPDSVSRIALRGVCARGQRVDVAIDR
jgi:hypothetical protein